MILRYLLLAFFLLAPSQAVMAADMFGRAEDPRAAEKTTSGPGYTLPDPIRKSLAASLEVQSRLNAGLRRELGRVRDGGTWKPAIWIIFLSFAYGVFHAVGPGHGKVVVGSYFLTRRARIFQGVAMSGAAALTQAVSAIFLVGVAAWVFDLAGGRLMAEAARLETVSYGVIVLLGLWMIWGVLSGRECCHDIPAGRDGACDHHRHDHHHHHDEPAGAAASAVHDHGHHGAANLSRLLLTGASVGLRPCSGAILVLLFTLANGIFAVGVLSTFAMALGVAVTVSLVGLAGLALQRAGERFGAIGAHPRLRRLVALAGAAFITLFGLLQIVGIVTGVITPMAG